MLNRSIKRHMKTYWTYSNFYITYINKGTNKSKTEHIRESPKMDETFKKEIVQRITKNLLDIQILRLINATPMWGYKIKKQIEALSGVKLRHGALYPLLNRMEREGFLTSQKQKQGKRTRKVYKITAKGKQYIEAYHNILKEQIQNF
jgi:DNA-binding PadR family transcriptional regulator